MSVRDAFSLDRVERPEPTREGIRLGLAVSVEWWILGAACKRMGITDTQAHALIASGHLVAEELPAERPSRFRSPTEWWIEVASALAWMKERDMDARAAAEEREESDGRKTDGYCNYRERGRRPVLYGLLDARDVAALDRRREQARALAAEPLKPLDPMELIRLRAGDLMDYQAARAAA